MEKPIIEYLKTIGGRGGLAGTKKQKLARRNNGFKKGNLFGSKQFRKTETVK